MKKTLSLLLCSLLLAALGPASLCRDARCGEKPVACRRKCVHLLRRGPHPPFDHFHPMEAMQYASL